MTDMEYMVNALMNLRPGAGWYLAGENYESLKWQDKTQSKPTETEFLEEVDRLRAEYAFNEYQRLRAPEYPPVEMYLDAVVKGDLAQQQAYIDACLAVKAKYPKPEEL